MHTTKKKPNMVLILIGFLFTVYLGYLLAGAWKEGSDLNIFPAALEQVLYHPFRNYLNEFTLQMVVFSALAYFIAILMYYTSQRNYMPGKEFGTSQLADVKQINKVLKDGEENRNRIYSQNIRMSLDTRKTKLNNNVLIIGGSGAGKTFYEVKPNIMQMNTSFVITDPKGEILEAPDRC